MISTDDEYIGTRLKYIVEVGSQGFSMEDDRFTVDIMRGPNAIHFEKIDMECDSSGNWYVCFDTRTLGSGTLIAKVTAYVPDDDFEDGFRVEVTKIKLLNIKV